MNIEYGRTSALPQILVNTEQDDSPLGEYGFSIIKNMRENYPERYWRMSFGGELMKKVNQRELELEEFKFFLVSEIEKKFPRPKTESFMEIASHMSLIGEQAEEIIRKEIIKPI